MRLMCFPYFVHVRTNYKSGKANKKYNMKPQLVIMKLELSSIICQCCTECAKDEDIHI